MRNITRATIALIGAVALVGGTAISASAETSGATAAVDGGTITISVPSTLSLASSGPGTAATGTLGAVTVIDNTASTKLWTVSMSVTAFTSSTVDETFTADKLTYTPSAANTAGSAGTITLAAPVLVTADVAQTPVAVQTTTAVRGNNTATWTSAISLAIPTTALAAADYTAVMTHSLS